MNDSEAEVLLRGVEIPVAVEQGVALGEAEGRDQAVDGLADGDALSAEGTVVQCGGQGEGFAAGREDLEVGELAVMRFVSASDRRPCRISQRMRSVRPRRW